MDNPIARREGNELGEQQRRRGGIDHQHCQLQRIAHRGQRDESLRLRDEMRGPRAGPDGQQHALAHLHRRDAAADGGNAPHPFIAAHRRQWRQHAVLTGEGEHIGGIDWRGKHLQQYLAGLRRWGIALHAGNDVLGDRTTAGVFGPLHHEAPERKANSADAMPLGEFVGRTVVNRDQLNDHETADFFGQLEDDLFPNGLPLQRQADG